MDIRLPMYHVSIKYLEYGGVIQKCLSGAN
jgi:hypothetical protein